ncbi:hypothetical protein KO527_20500 [Pseudoalteromonas sp. C2R02]|uniref:hypothetical protein n=1 Tax=Pseudoalteromonas sp. C2R02 TaxID=2841565 RepID=UPI001C08D52B|nr:hypothetical protein [Pseudoalteromonas sp. C2R02]MBU2971735.1 hypothetical protein [Pseudoalteromonas sp. C2R02]
MENTNNKTINKMHLFFLYLPTLTLGVSCFLMVLMHLDKGIDLTDEGFYIVSIANSYEHYISTTQFNHYAALLWKLSFNNLIAFRIVSLAILIILSFFLVEAVLNFYYNKEASFMKKFNGYVIALGSLLVFYWWWIPTPSYNWLNLLGCLLVANGLIRILIHTEYLKITRIWKLKIWLYLICIAVGGGLSGLSKPTTGLMLGLIVFGCITFSELRYKWGQINVTLIFFSFMFFYLHLTFFELSLIQFIERIKEAREYASTLRGVETVFIDVFGKSINEFINIPSYLVGKTPFSLTLLISLVLFHSCGKFFSTSSSLVTRNVNHYFLAMIIVIAWFELLLEGSWYGISTPRVNLGLDITIFVLIIIFCQIANSFLFQSVSIHRELPHLLLPLLFLCFAFAYGFGSSNGVLKSSTQAFVFFGLSAYISSLNSDLKNNNKVITWLVTFIILITSTLILKSAISKPYRIISPLAENNYEVTFLGNPTTLKVDKITADYITKLQYLALKSGWVEGANIIDMTGGTPLISFILNGKPIRKAWLLGWYKGSDEAALNVLSQEKTHVLKDAWVLIAPQGRGALDMLIFEKLGIDFYKNYQKVGEVITGYRNEKQELWRPVN